MFNRGFYFLILFFTCAFSFNSVARLLTPAEVHDFLDVHVNDMNKALPTAHKGYQAIAVAYHKMQENPFPDHQKEDVASYYARVILSVLHGIGFGGISETEIASEKESQVAYDALFAIGCNMKGDFAFQNSQLPSVKRHIQTCERFLELGKCKLEQIVQTQYGTHRFLPKIAFAIHLDTDNPFVRFYKTAYVHAVEVLEKKAKEAAEREFKQAIGKRESTRSQAKKIPPNSSHKQVKGQKTGASKPPFAENDFQEPWVGTLFRNAIAAEKAIQRGKNDEIAQNTGNLVVRILGKESYRTGTASVFHNQSGLVMAITNAHCVEVKSDVISTVELYFPDSDFIDFYEIFIHPLYAKDPKNYDVAILKGRSIKGFQDISILKEPITESTTGNGYMISYAKVNYAGADGKVYELPDRSRTLSVQRLERIVEGGRKIQIPRLLKKDHKDEGHGIYFKPVDDETHELDAAFSKGCSGSPYYLKVGGQFHLAGLMDSGIYQQECGLSIRISNISCVFPWAGWIDQVFNSLIPWTYMPINRRV